MDWATHVPLALLRSSANTFLCLSDSLGGGGGRGLLLHRTGSTLLSGWWSQMEEPSIMWFFGAQGLYAARVRHRQCLITSLPLVDKGNYY